MEKIWAKSDERQSLPEGLLQMLLCSRLSGEKESKQLNFHSDHYFLLLLRNWLSYETPLPAPGRCREALRTGPFWWLVTRGSTRTLRPRPIRRIIAMDQTWTPAPSRSTHRARPSCSTWPDRSCRCARIRTPQAARKQNPLSSGGGWLSRWRVPWRATPDSPRHWPPPFRENFSVYRLIIVGDDSRWTNFFFFFFLFAVFRLLDMIRDRNRAFPRISF